MVKMNCIENNEEKTEKDNLKKKDSFASFQKICLVCGDKALGYNFNAISCESCKAFFRRNALTNKELKCPFTNNCDITIVTRRFCQKCRLEKCLAIGMVKEFIMSDEDKAEKRRKIEENRAKKRQIKDSEDAVTSSKNVKLDGDVSNSYAVTQDSGIIQYNISDVTEPSIIQYNVLNSTTCSPNSTVQSPINIEMETSQHSPPIYQPYVPVQSSDNPYTMKVYPMEDSRSQYENANIESYNMYDSLLSVDENSYSKSSKQNLIRSMLTNGNMVETEGKQHICEELPPPSINPDGNKARDILQDVERIEPNSMESILCEAIKLEFEAYTSINTCNGSSRELNEVERAKLNELIVANKALHDPIDDDMSQLIGNTASTQCKEGNNKHDPRLVTIVNFTAVAIRRFIKMAKKINAFKNMCEEDQVALLKGGCIEMMILRSTMTYNDQKNYWKLPHSEEKYGKLKTDVLKLAKGNIYRLYESFIYSFDPKWRTDENVILVMSAILLFSPDRPKGVHKDVIKLEQNSYYYLLRRYLESVYAGCEAKSTFLKLIQKILELRKLAEEITGVYLDVNPIEPLLMEIFDLKHSPT